jgi:hypothetical protein
MEEIRMQSILPIYEETPTTTRIFGVEEHKEIIQVSIQILNHIERESFGKDLLRPTRLTSKIQHFVKNATNKLHQ